MTKEEFEKLRKFVKATDNRMDNLEHLKSKLDDLRLNINTEYISKVLYALQSVSAGLYDTIVSNIIEEIDILVEQRKIEFEKLDLLKVVTKLQEQVDA